MSTPVNITPTAESDGLTYCTAVPLTPSEADLGDKLLAPAPVAVVYGQIISAVVQLTVVGLITGNGTLVVMQTDMGDGVWIDVAWAFWNATQGKATFVLNGGVIGSTSNSFQQTRNPGFLPTPQANGSNAVPLMGRVRFTGFAQMTGGSSSAPGTTAQVTATIKYKLLTPR